MIGVKELKEIAINVVHRHISLIQMYYVKESIRCRKFLAVELQYVMQ